MGWTMNKLAGLVATFLLTEAAATAQVYVPQFSRPALPLPAALDRLNLQMAWYTYLPVDGKRDGPWSLQVSGNQVVVQLLSGMVVSLDATTGYTNWRTQAGLPYQEVHAPGINKRHVFAVNGPRLFGLDRATGRIQWEFDLPTAPTAPPVADEQRIYLGLGNGDFSIYQIMEPGQKQEERGQPQMMYSAYRTGGSQLDVYRNAFKIRETSGLQPVFQVGHPAEILLDYPPMLSPNLVTVGGSGGKFFSTTRAIPGPFYRFLTDYPLSAAPGSHRDAMYLPTRDAVLHSLNLESGRVLWTWVGTGEPITRKPEVTDQDVYVTREKLGLHRLDRATGRVLWQNVQADRFLGANPKFVYAADRQNRLLILDRQRGSTLAELDTRFFIAPIANEMTDRIFLASNDGLVICLHDRQYAQPLKMKTMEELPPPMEKKPPPKPPEGEMKNS